MHPSRRPRLARFLRALVLVALACAIAAPTGAAAAPVTPSALRVCIDPGHGGGYSGAVYGGVAEKTLNLQISRKLATELRARGIDAVLTRDSDRKLYNGGGLRTWRWIESRSAYAYEAFPATDANDRLRLDLQARCDKALSSGADLFVSVHCNAGGSSARGIEVYTPANDPLGRTFGADLLGGMLGRTGAANRGSLQANFYVIRWSNQPAALVECGFMSNPNELARLKSASYQWQLARGIADGIERFAKRPVNERVSRIAGATRYGTAAAVAQAGWSAGADTVVLASGDLFSDSLVAAPLAAKLGAPILTSPPRALDKQVAAELARLQPSRLVIVGGERSVPAALAAEAAKASGVATESVERIAGADRYEVSVNVARALESSATSAVVVASGEVWPDALSIAASAASRGEPILLSRPGGLSDQALAYITAPDSPKAVTVVGGARTLPTSALRGVAFERLAGSDRYETNWAVFQRRYTETEKRTAFVASGERFPDALVLGPLAARQGRPVLLMGKSASSKELRPWVYARRSVPLGFQAVGGTASVTAYLEPMLEKWRMRAH